jgi:hypothetical protein
MVVFFLAFKFLVNMRLLQANDVSYLMLLLYLQGARHTFAEGMGKNVANPTAMLLCSANMLKHAGLDQYSAIIKGAVDKVIKAGKVGYSKRFVYIRLK